MQREITKKNNVFLHFHQVIYLLYSISCLSLKLLAVLFLEISSFLCPHYQKAITKKKKTFSKNLSPGNLLIILYLLTKFEAPNCYTF